MNRERRYQKGSGTDRERLKSKISRFGEKERESREREKVPIVRSSLGGDKKAKKREEIQK